MALPTNEEEQRSVPFWSVLALPALALVLVVVTIQASAQLRAWMQGVGFEDALRAVQMDALNTGAVQALAFFGALAYGLRRFMPGASVRRAVSLAPVPVQTVLFAVVAGAALQFPLAEVGNVLQEIFPLTVEQQLLRQRMVTPRSLGEGITIVLAVVVIAPVTEEFLFRGFLLPGLAERYGDGLAVGATSIAFGLIHLNATAIVYATLAGVLFGIVALRARSVWPAVALHASVNAMPVLLPERLIPIPGFNIVGEDVYHLALPLLIGSGAIAALALYFMMRTIPEHDH